MHVSENGWQILAREDLHWFTAAGQRFAAANTDVAVVAQHFITRFHVDIEPISGPVTDDWSYADRMVRGSTVTRSNHGSATAWDLNALKHPRGVRGTFTAMKAMKLRHLARSITDNSGDRVLRLGMDFQTVPDDMHVEICAGPRSVRQAAEKIRAARKAQEDEVKDSDIQDIARAVVKLLSNTANVPNQTLHPGDQPAVNFTAPGALSNIEKNQDQENERTAHDRELDAVTRRQVSEIHAIVVAKPGSKAQ